MKAKQLTIGITAALSLLSACGGHTDEAQFYGRNASGPPSGLTQNPHFARVWVVGMLIGPGKADGSQWDGPGGMVKEDLWDLLAQMLIRPSAYGAAASVMAGPAMQALEKPDVGGTATLITASGDGPAIPLAKKQDTFTPQWSGVAWDHVPLDESVRIRVVATDRDLMEDDPMGIFDISAADMLEAVRTGKVYPVPVHAQTNKQILFALISAMPQ